MSESRKQAGQFSWNELLTTDADGAVSFYTSLFGWTTAAMPMGDFTYHILKKDGEDVGGLMPMPDGGDSPSWGAYVTVEDVDATVKKAEELGGRVVFPPKDIPVGRIATIRDPQGAEISVISYATQ